MRLQVAALAAALAVTAAGTVPVSSRTMQDVPGDGVRLFLVRLERIVQHSDLAAYNALLDESADRDRAARFLDGELIPGMTRAVIQERDRGPLPGTLPGNGYTIVVDVFEEYGDRARVSTWWLDLMRDRDARTAAEWLIADQGRLSSVEDLYRLSLNPATEFTAHNLEFRDEDLKLTLADGSVFVSGTDQGTTALVLVGRGDMSFHPAPETEQSQVKIFSGANGIETRFDAAYLRINPGDFDRLISRRQLVSRPVDQNDFRAADRIFREDFPKSYSLELGDLSRDTWSLLPRPRDLVAEIRTRRFNTLTYSRSSSLREDISLFDRNSRKTIAVYSSPLNARQEVSLASEDETGDFDVWHYDIDVTSTPDRRWIEGRARLSIRVGANPISSLTLRLADPLVVQSVVSAEYGRLFNMRVRDQNSVVVSLPTSLAPGAELTLAVTYAGRLEPQTLDAETMAIGQFGGAQSDAIDIFKRPEPSFVYSNQSNWYPRPSGNHYATARLRITVPDSLACVASGERDPESPALVTAKDSSRRKVYVFNAVQPLRYLAFVVSRLSTIQTIATDSLKVSVEANPGHVRRGRELADRAVEIAQFYRSLLGDSPYPTFTVALVEGDLPGGHSPGYFAVLNEPLSSVFVPRNDPASFENYPDFFLAHELAHQWWGQAVGWRNYHEQWLSEGFAQYFAALYAEQRGLAGLANPGTPGSNVLFRGVMRQMRKWAIDQTDQGPISLGYRLGHIQGNSRIMRALVYDKGAIVLHMLRHLVGDDAFFRGLQRFYRASRFRSAGTLDFQVAMEAEARRPLDRFFDGWIYGSTLPRLNFSYRVEGADVVLHIEQMGDVFELPITVTLQYTDRTSAEVVVPVTNRRVDLRVPLTGTLRTAEISKDDFSLATLKTLN